MIATVAQLTAAQGANWCAVGFVNSGAATYPMQNTQNGCGSSGINYGSDYQGSYGVNIYGVKPSQTTYPVWGTASIQANVGAIAPFNITMWSQYTN